MRLKVHDQGILCLPYLVYTRPDCALFDFQAMKEVVWHQAGFEHLKEQPPEMPAHIAPFHSGLLELEPEFPFFGHADQSVHAGAGNCCIFAISEYPANAYTTAVGTGRTQHDFGADLFYIWF